LYAQRDDDTKKKICSELFLSGSSHLLPSSEIHSLDLRVSSSLISLEEFCFETTTDEKNNAVTTAQRIKNILLNFLKHDTETDTEY
jgi:exosortase/archaeosortase